MLFLFSCVIILGNATSISETLNHIEQSSFGDTILRTLQLQLQTNEPIGRIIDTLQNLEDRLRSDQKEDDLDNRSFQDQCTRDLSSLDGEIDEINRQKVKQRGIIDQLNPLIEARQSDLKDKSQKRKEQRTSMSQIDVVREYEVKEFTEKRNEMSQLTRILEEVKVIFATKFRPNFMELQTDDSPIPQDLMMMIQTQLKKAKNFESFALPYQSIVQLMSRVKSSGSNEGIVKNIITLCDQLLKHIDDTFQVEKKAEDSRAHWYDQYHKLMGNQFQTFDADVERLQAEIQDLIARRDAAVQKVFDMDVRIESKGTQNKDKRTECDEAAYDYTQRRSQRDLDRNVVSETIQLVNTNARDIKEAIAQRLAAGDNI